MSTALQGCSGGQTPNITPSASPANAESSEAIWLHASRQGSHGGPITRHGDKGRGVGGAERDGGLQRRCQMVAESQSGTSAMPGSIPLRASSAANSVAGLDGSGAGGGIPGAAAGTSRINPSEKAGGQDTSVKGGVAVATGGATLIRTPLQPGGEGDDATCCEKTLQASSNFGPQQISFGGGDGLSACQGHAFPVAAGATSINGGCGELHPGGFAPTGSASRLQIDTRSPHPILNSHGGLGPPEESSAAVATATTMIDGSQDPPQQQLCHGSPGFSQFVSEASGSPAVVSDHTAPRGNALPDAPTPKRSCSSGCPVLDDSTHEDVSPTGTSTPAARTSSSSAPEQGSAVAHRRPSVAGSPRLSDSQRRPSTPSPARPGTPEARLKQVAAMANRLQKSVPQDIPGAAGPVGPLVAEGQYKSPRASSARTRMTVAHTNSHLSHGTTQDSSKVQVKGGSRGLGEKCTDADGPDAAKAVDSSKDMKRFVVRKVSARSVCDAVGSPKGRLSLRKEGFDAAGAALAGRERLSLRTKGERGGAASTASPGHKSPTIRKMEMRGSGGAGRGGRTPEKGVVERNDRKRVAAGGLEASASSGGSWKVQLDKAGVKGREGVEQTPVASGGGRGTQKVQEAGWIPAGGRGGRAGVGLSRMSKWGARRTTDSSSCAGSKNCSAGVEAAGQQPQNAMLLQGCRMPPGAGRMLDQANSHRAVRRDAFERHLFSGGSGPSRPHATRATMQRQQQRLAALSPTLSSPTPCLASPSPHAAGDSNPSSPQGRLVALSPAMTAREEGVAKALADSVEELLELSVKAEEPAGAGVVSTSHSFAFHGCNDASVERASACTGACFGPWVQTEPGQQASPSESPRPEDGLGWRARSSNTALTAAAAALATPDSPDAAARADTMGGEVVSPPRSLDSVAASAPPFPLVPQNLFTRSFENASAAAVVSIAAARAAHAYPSYSPFALPHLSSSSDASSAASLAGSYPPVAEQSFAGRTPETVGSFAYKSRCAALLRPDLFRHASSGVQQQAVRSALALSDHHSPRHTAMLPPSPTPVTQLTAPSSAAPSSGAGLVMPSLAAWVPGPTSGTDSCSYTLTVASTASARVESTGGPSTAASVIRGKGTLALSSTGGITLSVRTHTFPPPCHSAPRSSINGTLTSQLSRQNVPDAVLPHPGEALCTTDELPRGGPVEEGSESTALHAAMRAEASKGNVLKGQGASLCRRGFTYDGSTNVASAVLAAMEGDSEGEEDYEVCAPCNICASICTIRQDINPRWVYM
jgi:hypothetical protein